MFYRYRAFEEVNDVVSEHLVTTVCSCFCSILAKWIAGWEKMRNMRWLLGSCLRTLKISDASIAAAWLVLSAHTHISDSKIVFMIVIVLVSCFDFLSLNHGIRNQYFWSVSKHVKLGHQIDLLSNIISFVWQGPQYVCTNFSIFVCTYCSGAQWVPLAFYLQQSIFVMSYTGSWCTCCEVC